MEEEGDRSGWKRLRSERRRWRSRDEVKEVEKKGVRGEEMEEVKETMKWKKK